VRNFLRNRAAFSLILLALLGHACSGGGYGPQPAGSGGYPGAGQAGRGGDAAMGGAGNFIDTAGIGGPVGGAGGIAGSGGTAGSGGSGGSSGGAGAGGTLSPVNPPSCDAIGSEPTIPTACATVTATKTIVAGEPSDETLDTDAINAALSACSVGQAVRLAVDGDKTAFVAAGISLKTGVSLLLDAGTTVFLSRDPRDSDQTAGKCAGNNTGNGACKPLISVLNPMSSGVFGTGTLDGRGGEVITGGTSNWWDLEDMYSGNLAAPRLIQVTSGTNFILHDITLKNAPKFHVVIDSTVGFTVWGITINTPPDSPNTDGVDPSRTKNGVIAYTKISTGDDNIAVKGGGPTVVDGLIVAHNHFGRGHGMSIGSETNGGVRNVSVCDLSLDGTDNGLRIKSDSSRGGLVQGIAYSDICIRNSRHPLVFDPYYSSSTGTLIPDFRDITVRNVHVLGTGGTNSFKGWDAAHPLGITLSNVVFDTAPTTINASYANIVLGPDPVNIAPAGTSVTVTGQVTGTAAPRGCDDAWVTF
jgi:polygalacturonase